MQVTSEGEANHTRSTSMRAASNRLSR